MAKKSTMTTAEIQSHVERMIDQSQGQAYDELSAERTKSMNYYEGNMKKEMPVAKDRSNVVSRDVLDAVESTVPSIMKIYSDAENAIEFSPTGPEDVDAAAQETAVVRHIIFEGNKSYLKLYTFIKDALLSKTGIFKVAWEDSEWKREEYKRLTKPELDNLLNKDGIEIEVLEEHYDKEKLTWHIVCRTKREAGEVVFYSVPPEEFGIDRNANSPNPKDANFIFHRVKKTAYELMNEGYDKELVDTLPYDDGITNEEQLARYRYNDEQLYSNDATKSLRIIWITEAYIYLDLDDDGISELIMVTLAGGGNSSGSGSATLKYLDHEEVDTIPFVATSPIIRTHAFFGHSMADLVLDIQELRTLMLRSVVDNTMQATNQRTAINELVNVDDIMSSAPGGLVRVEGEGPPANSIMAMPSNQMSTVAYDMLAYLKDEMKQRTGVGEGVVGLDANALSNINTGVAIMAMEESRMRIELIARNMAECGLKDLFLSVHELLQKNGSKELAIELNGQWVTVRPDEWRARTNMRVNVGIGRDSKAKRLAMIDDTLSTQLQLVEKGFGLANPQNIYEGLIVKSKLMGIDGTVMFTDPSTLPPPEPAQPTPYEQGMLQIQQRANEGTLQIQHERLLLDRDIANMKANSIQIEADAATKRVAIDEQSEIMAVEARTDAVLLSTAIEGQKLDHTKEVDAGKAAMEMQKQEHNELMDTMKLVVEQQKLSEKKFDSVLEAIVKGGHMNTELPHDLEHDLVDEVVEELMEDNLEKEITHALHEAEEGEDVTIVGVEASGKEEKE